MTTGRCPDYNRIFERLVDSAESDFDQISGLIAYALYKERKRKWLMSFKKREDRRPGPSEEQIFLSAYDDKSALDDLRNRADTMLAGFANTYVEQSAED